MIAPPLALKLVPLALLASAAPAQTGGWSVQEHPKLASGTAEAGQGFGSQLAVDGDTAAVAGYSQVWILLRDPTSGAWNEVAEITEPPNAAGFPEAIALSGDTLVVGVPFALNIFGAALVFERDLGGPDAWGLAATLSASDGLYLDQFGVSVAIDGDTLAVGAELDHHGEGQGSAYGGGSVYVYERTAGAWSQVQKLTVSTTQPGYPVLGAQFGRALALEGSTLVVGAPDAHSSGPSSPGTAFVFARDPQTGTWQLTDALQASDAEASDWFASTLALDGDVLAVGATKPNPQGESYVLRRAGTVWTEVAKLLASDGEPGDLFGSSLSVLGSTLVVGAPYKDAGGQHRAGGAYLYERDQDGAEAWGEIAVLEASDGYVSDELGSAVAAVPGGALIGSPGDGVGIDHIENVEGLAFDPTTGSWFGIDQQKDKLVSIDALTGYGKVISNVTLPGTNNLLGLAFDTDAGVLYAIDYWGELVVIDPLTGLSTAEIPTNLTGLSCLEYDAASGLLYGVQYGLQALVTLDPASGVGQSPVLGFDDLKALAFDPAAGVLYGSTHDSAELVAVDTATGLGTAIGPLGFAWVEALTFDPASGTLYGADNQLDHLIAIDTATGAGASVAAYSGGIEVVGMAFDPATGLIWALDDDGNSLLTIDPGSGVHVEIGGYGNNVPIQALALDPASGSLFGTTVSPPHWLLSIDKTTGAATPVGQLGFGGVAGLAFDPNTGTLFGSDTQLQRLITIDTATGAGTALSPPLGFESIQGLVLDPDTGLLLAADMDSDNLLSIDPATSLATVIGPLGLDEVQALALDPVSGRLLGTNGASNTGNGELVEIDPTTGAATVIGPISGTLSIGSIYPYEVGYTPLVYCTPGTSASGCQASIGASGTASASAPSGFDLLATGVEGERSGLFYFGTGGQQASPWGNGTSLQCVVPPLTRTQLLAGSGAPGTCNGSLALDLNQVFSLQPSKNPGAGSFVQAQLWYRDPQNTSNQTTGLSDALQLYVAP